MSDYIEGELDPAERKRLERHADSAIAATPCSGISNRRSDASVASM